MFGFLKKKLSKLVESVSKKTEEKEGITEEKKSVIETVEKEEIQIEQVEEKPIEKIQEEPVIETVEKEKEKVEEKIIEPQKDQPEIEEITKPIEELEEIKTPIKELDEKPLVEIEKIEEKVEEKKSWITKIKEKIVKQVTEKKLTGDDLQPILNELENDLIESDVAYEVAEKIKNDLKSNLVDKEIKRGKEKEIVIQVLKKSLLEILSIPKMDIEEIIKKSKLENKPTMILFFGMNGTGKSLNLTKLAKWLQDKKYRPILAAGDTFRAAGDIQLELYAEKIQVPVIKHQRGADSCAVIFDAKKAAEARGYDVVLGDTSGRMHTKKDLIDELIKIIRVNKPDLKILVLDSLAGSDVLQQFEFFDKAVGVDAIIFSKVDVNEKGGNILSICHNFKKPIIFLGVGQELKDIMEYSPEKFVDNLLS